ncbi:MAG: ABC transporter ATP-binding protein [Alphaproteobacteria bacterium]|nr:ABC transporter ATP-binding protein [Alphaproteobacteria bacterium]MCB9929855.1 ABC transporter ATP-binding protein [Alphaproteobacteria bacterium]
MSDPALELSGVVREYRQGSNVLRVLDGLDLRLMPGEIVALVGPSGAGKSTLLQIAGLLDNPDRGAVRLGNRDCARLSDAERSAVRRAEIGFVFQFHHLLPEFTALENIVLPQLIAGVGRRAAQERARELLASVGLTERASHRPAELSGGEQQRVAIARALANRPRVLLADEPTGNLDQVTGERVADQLVRLAHETGVAALVATHNMALAAAMDRVVRMEGGRLVDGL